MDSRNGWNGTLMTCAVLAAAGALGGVLAARTPVSVDEDKKAVAELDREYQQAVKQNDVPTMDRILADDFVLVTGTGHVQTKMDLLKESGSGDFSYERQEDSNQTVRVWGDTAVVTALLWAKGTERGKAFEYKVWFSDVYLKTAKGWRYVFGQAAGRVE
jgi:ketosteroid isomerase-like protein